MLIKKLVFLHQKNTGNMAEEQVKLLKSLIKEFGKQDLTHQSALNTLNHAGIVTSSGDFTGYYKNLGN